MPSSDNKLPEDFSKSQRKRDMLELQKMGEELVNLTFSQLDQIELDTSLRDAILLCKTLKTHEAIRRQLQYIGKLMRHVDAEPIHAALQKIKLKHQFGKAQFHQIERLREQLITEGDSALQSFIAEHPESDHQHIRQLIRKAQQDRAKQKNSGAETELFRLLREIIGS